MTVDYLPAKQKKGAVTFTGDRDLIKEMLGANKVSGISVNAQRSILTLRKPKMRMQEETFSDDGKLIAADFSLNREDGKDLPGLRWDDTIFQQYKEYMTDLGVGTKNLKHVSRVDVKNPATLAIIKQAYKETEFQSAGGNVATFRADSADVTEVRAFDALSRSHNVNRVCWLLSDFHQEMGNKRVAAIHTSLDDEGDVANLVIDIEV